MTTCTAFFYTEADWARATLEADSPELALQRGREIEANETEELDFQPYDSPAGVERIDIRSIDPTKTAPLPNGPEVTERPAGTHKREPQRPVAAISS